MGGRGDDVFVFGDELANGDLESHVLRDYEVGADAIDLGGFEVGSYEETSGSVVLRAGPDNDVITVRGVGGYEMIEFIEDTLF